jgi:glycosyltransferase involved in cell wall biosynthesis
MNKRERILIIFDGSHLAYSPTTLQLYEEFSKKYDVTVIAQTPEGYNGQEAPIQGIQYLRVYNRKDRYFWLLLFPIALLFSKTARTFKKNKVSYKDYFFRYLPIKKTIRENKFKRIICVDNRYLFFCSLLGVKVDWVSLELCLNEHLIPLVNRAVINCVIIQSEERYHYLFGQEKLPLFYIQNAPPYEERTPKKERKSLIYAGSTIAALGFYYCLDFLVKYPEEKLTVLGAFFEADKERVNREYRELLDSKRLTIISKYLENNEVVEFLSDFEIGFVFYNFEDELLKEHYFNYKSAPSGKMFKYIAGGVPVVCSDISGFAFVKEFNCGVLISDLSPDSIKQAIQTIRSNFDMYVQNSLKAAEHFAFDRAIIPYLKFIGE